MKRSDLSERLFVYGTEINDLLAVDYDAISMLNVSATQELSKQLDDAKAKIDRLEKQNQSLQSRLDEQPSISEFNKLKASVETMQQILGAKAQK